VNLVCADSPLTSSILKCILRFAYHVIREFAEGRIHDSSNQFQRIVGRVVPMLVLQRSQASQRRTIFCFPAFSFLPCLSSRHPKTPCTTCRTLNNFNSALAISVRYDLTSKTYMHINDCTITLLPQEHDPFGQLLDPLCKFLWPMIRYLGLFAQKCGGPPFQADA